MAVQSSTGRHPGLASTILAVGAVVYLLLCLPAIGRRGYPPIDRIWIGVTYLWIVPVCLSSVFDSYKNRSRRNQLIVYAFGTALIAAGTFHDMTPRSLGLFLILTLTLFMYGPVHLFVAFCTEYVMQKILGRFYTFVEDPVDATGSQIYPRVGLIVIFIVICLGIGFPFAYRSFIYHIERESGYRAAEAAWNDSTAVILVQHNLVQHNSDSVVQDDSDYVDNTNIQRHFDRKTGLPYKRYPADLGFAKAYNTTIRALVRMQGIPPWAMQEPLPKNKDFIFYLSKKALPDFTEVAEFPHHYSANIILVRKSLSSSNDESIYITSGTGTTIGFGKGFQNIYTRQVGETVIVRAGNTWLGVFHTDGRTIAKANR